MEKEYRMKKIKRTKTSRWSLMGTKKKIGIIAGIVVGVLGLAAGAVYLYISHMISLVHIVPSSSVVQTSTVSSMPMPMEKDVLNVLLIGIDSRNTVTDPVGRSDSMILVSLNTRTKRIVMTSFMRDSYVEIPGYGKRRLNAAYQYGGADLLVTTIEQDFKIDIDYYVKVDFFDFMEIIDKLGGVTIDVTEKELPILNMYVRDMNKLLKAPVEDQVLPAAGTGLTLTGKQALGYSRIRYIGDDFKRTERQRIVLNQVLNKMKGKDFFTLNSILVDLLPNITTNMDENKIKALLWNAPSYLNYTVVQSRVPMEGSYENITVGGAEVLSVDTEMNANELQKQIYGAGDESQTSTVTQASAISSTTQSYASSQ